MTFLSGYKTYLLGAAALITIGLSFFGLVDANTANILLSIFGFGGLITLRSAINS